MLRTLGDAALARAQGVTLEAITAGNVGFGRATTSPSRARRTISISS